MINLLDKIINVSDERLLCLLLPILPERHLLLILRLLKIIPDIEKRKTRWFHRRLLAIISEEFLRDKSNTDMQLNTGDLRKYNFERFRWEVRSSFENIQILFRVIFPAVLIRWYSGRQLPDIFPTVLTNGYSDVLCGMQRWCLTGVLVKSITTDKVGIQLVIAFSLPNFSHKETSQPLPTTLSKLRSQKD